MRDAVKPHIALDATSHRSHQELDDYLAAPLEDVDNVVAWWGVSLHFIFYDSELILLAVPFYTVPYNISHHKRLPGHSRFCCSIRTLFF